VVNTGVRRQLFDGSDELLANAIAEVSRVASKEALMFDGWEGFGPGPVADFVAAYGTSSA
jgi:hypothetical protein